MNITSDEMIHCTQHLYSLNFHFIVFSKEGRQICVTYVLVFGSDKDRVQISENLQELEITHISTVSCVQLKRALQDIKL